MEQTIVTNGINPPSAVVQGPPKRGRKPGSKNKPKPAWFAPIVASAGGGEAARKQAASKAKPKGKPGPKPKAQKQAAPVAAKPSTFVPVEGIDAALAVLGWAEKKYANKPWQSRGETAEQHLLKAIGHLAASLTGKKTDEESGLSSIAHAAARLLIALSLK
jgi:hypothetical protein